MASVKIDGKDYDVDDLSEEAKANLISLQFTQSEITKLESQLSVYKTAAAAYSSTLKREIDK
tara:strand:+ start:686 stop:871 length:186 start_codon:yes stop_codon:yes gene_type:complete